MLLFLVSVVSLGVVRTIGATVKEKLTIAKKQIDHEISLNTKD
jgi:hypothetical protein